MDNIYGQWQHDDTGLMADNVKGFGSRENRLASLFSCTAQSLIKQYKM